MLKCLKTYRSIWAARLPNLNVLEFYTFAKRKYFVGFRCKSRKSLSFGFLPKWKFICKQHGRISNLLRAYFAGNLLTGLIDSTIFVTSTSFISIQFTKRLSVKVCVTFFNYLSPASWFLMSVVYVISLSLDLHVLALVPFPHTRWREPQRTCLTVLLHPSICCSTERFISTSSSSSTSSSLS